MPELQDAKSKPEKGPVRGIRVDSPATGETLGEVPILDAAEVGAAVARARTAQESWGLLPIEERCERILGFRDAIVDRAEDLVRAIVAETGKPKLEALVHEVVVTVDLATHYAKRAPRILAPREIELNLLKHRRSYVHYAPLGVVGVISPWNFPFMIPFCEAITALLAGNAVVIKPSEITPLIALEGKKIWDAAGLSSDLLQVVTGDGGTGAALIDARPDKIAFTGAVQTGRKIAAACGERLVPCHLELGGKAAAIVCADADVERAARAIVTGGFANAGQACVSVERVYAHATIHDALVERVTQLAEELRRGDPAKADTEVGAIIFPKQLEVVERLVADAEDKGAKLRTGGERREGKGRFYEPTVLSGCTPDMAVMREEIFGPVVPIMKIEHEDEAIRLANDSPLGLAGYVFTKDRERGRRIAERVRAGSVMVNDVLSAYSSPEAPFGGVKDSGFGRIHGDEGLREMCEVRHVSYDRITLGNREPYWYPYNERTYTAAAKAIKLLFRRGSPVRKILDLF